MTKNINIIIILMEIDFPVVKFMILDGGERVINVPCPPIISIHPPSKDF